ncbi:MAG: glycosyltransferase family 1 protein [Bacteroidales bacterium]|nr:glycosyltransferase family 1 protein [Bacteroidales bacterium]
MKGLTIGYDGKRAVENMTGLGNYSRVVLGTMSALYPDNRYVVMAPRMRHNPRLEPLTMRGNIEFVGPSTALGRRLPSWWRTMSCVGAMAEAGLDLYHGLSNEIPLSAGMAPCPTVVTVHDLIWRRVPEDYNAVDRWIYEFKYGRSARRATRVIAISERTKADMVSDWGIADDKIDVIYQGCDPIFSRPVTADDRMRVRETYRLPARYIISVGTVAPRKNQMLAVKALESLPGDVALVIAGGSHKRYGGEIDSYISAHGLGDRVIRLEGVPFGDLPALYACASLSSYTSRYEGFGLPVVESLSVGTPVVACTGSCLEEAGGPGAVYVDPDDVRGYAEAAAAILSQQRLHDKLADRGRRYVARFNPADFATQTMKTYNKAILDHTLRQIK